MFKLFYLRKHLPKNWNEKTKNALMLIRPWFYMNLVVTLILVGTVSLALSGAIYAVIVSIKEEQVVDTITEIIMFILLVRLYCWFDKNFHKEVHIFENLVVCHWYFIRCTSRGNAITGEDFDVLKKENKEEYDKISTLRCNGHCYYTCFELLRTLKKGKIMYVSVPRVGKDNKTKETSTMHVIYVQNDWCFDTYSCRQYPLEQFMKDIVIKVYRTFQLSDIKDVEYEVFRDGMRAVIEEWCKANDCYYYTLSKQK